MAFTCKLVDRKAEPAYVVRTRTPVVQIPRALGPAWGKVLAHPVASECSRLVHRSPPTTTRTCRTCSSRSGSRSTTPFDRPLDGHGAVEAAEIPEGKAVEAVHVGPYDHVPATYEALGRWMETNGYTPEGPAYEFYLNDPQETQPDELRTKVGFAVQ